MSLFESGFCFCFVQTGVQQYVMKIIIVVIIIIYNIKFFTLHSLLSGVFKNKSHTHSHMLKSCNYMPLQAHTTYDLVDTLFHSKQRAQ